MSDEKPKRGRKWASIAEDQDEIRSRVKELLETHSTGDISTLYGIDAHSILPKVRGERHFTKRDWHRLFVEPVPDTRELELRAWKKFKTGSTGGNYTRVSAGAKNKKQEIGKIFGEYEL